MKYLEKPEIMVLKGDEAIETLNNYKYELKKGSAEELTQEQRRTLIETANGLIKSIQNDIPTKENMGKALLLPKITETHTCVRIWGYL